MLIILGLILIGAGTVVINIICLALMHAGIGVAELGIILMLLNGFMGAFMMWAVGENRRENDYEEEDEE